MNSNTLRYIATGAYFVIGCLVVFNVITEKEALGVLAAAIAAKEFGQSYLTPSTNQHTPDDIPPPKTTLFP